MSASRDRLATAQVFGVLDAAPSARTQCAQQKACRAPIWRYPGSPGGSCRRADAMASLLSVGRGHDEPERGVCSGRQGGACGDAVANLR